MALVWVSITTRKVNMAKNKYTLFPHDDLDVSYFKELIGANELDALFLNAETFMSAVGIAGIKDYIESTITLFSLTDDMRVIRDYCEYLFEMLQRKITNNIHKEAIFQQTLEALITVRDEKRKDKIDTSILRAIEEIQHDLLCSPVALNEHCDSGEPGEADSDPVDEAVHAEIDKVVSDEVELDKSQMNSQTIYAQTLDAIAKTISEKLIELANAVCNSERYKSMPGETTDFLAHVTMVMLLDIPRVMVNDWIESESNFKKVFDDAKNNSGFMDMSDFGRAIIFANDSMTLSTALSLNMETFYEPVKIILFASYYISTHIEEINSVATRSQTLSPDRFLYKDQIKRSFGSGSKHKLDNVSIKIRNITYKIWLYYWQHSQEKFKSSTATKDGGPYVTGPEMIQALAEAFPKSWIAFGGDDGDLASRQNLISELYKYPSLVDEYFNHKSEE